MSLDIENFGCRLNALDGDYIRQAAEAAGLKHATIINSCAVTTQAIRQARQAVRKAAKKTAPKGDKQPIFVTGCAAQIDEAQFATMPQVARVIGNADKRNPKAYRPHAPAQQISNIQQDESITKPAARQPMPTQKRARALVQVQTGCNHRCTFCIIPFGRGNARSQPIADIVRDCRALIQQGHKEIIFTGIDITSWGADIGEGGLATLIRAVLDKVPDLARLRLSSLDVGECDAALLDLIAHEPRLMPHLHLSLQAGDDMILKRMKRRHTHAQAVSICDYLKQHRTDIVFGADIIAGFPTETDSMFDNSLKLVRACELVWLHVFPFSPRPNTPAARMPQLPAALIKERAARLRKAGARQRKAWLVRQVGRTLPVLLESATRGRTEHFAQIELRAQIALGTKPQSATQTKSSQLIQAHVTAHNGDMLYGEIV